MGQAVQEKFRVIPAQSRQIAMPVASRPGKSEEPPRPPGPDKAPAQAPRVTSAAIMLLEPANARSVFRLPSRHAESASLVRRGPALGARAQVRNQCDT